MADLYGGTGRAANEAIAARIAQTSSGGMRTPTEILRQREARDAAREARRLAEAEAAGDNNSRRRVEEDRRRSGEQRGTTQGSQATVSGYRHVSAEGKHPVESALINPLAGPAVASGDSYTRHGSNNSAVGFQGTSRADASRVRSTTITHEQPRTYPENIMASPRTTRAESQSQPKQDPAPYTSTAQESKQPRMKRSSSFPQAWERWETLSSHWEGLTSYWIRRMESNDEQIRQEPMAQQMSRQIVDLTSAGANLFHAVVELQRLRASSEKKFQRWFAETREKLRVAEETRNGLERQLRDERERGGNERYFSKGEREQSKDTATREEVAAQAEVIARSEEEKQILNRLIAEMKRELQITREEARRAWEELGRREQEERNRITLLNEGHPISVGGVQVVPTLGMASRGNSLRRPEQHEQGLPPQTPAASQARGGAPYDYEQQHEPSPTDTDPFSSGAAQPPQSPVRNPAYMPTGFTSYASGTMPPFTYSSGAGLQAGSRSNPQIREQQQQQQSSQSTTQHSQQPGSPHSSVQQQRSTPFYHHNSSFLHHDQPTSQQSPESNPGDASSRVPHHDETEQSSRSQGGTLSNITSAVAAGLHTLTDAVGLTHPDPSASTHAESSHAQSKSRAEDDDDSNDDEEAERERARAALYKTTAAPPQPSAARPHELAADYEGAGYDDGSSEHHDQGLQATAGAVVLEGGDHRHHHPTRLSDVVEEDERSRTTRRSSGSEGY